MDSYLQDIIDFIEKEKASGAQRVTLTIGHHERQVVFDLLIEKGYIKPGEKIDYTGDPRHPNYRRFVAQDLTIHF